jgi:protein CpxP
MKRSLLLLTPLVLLLGLSFAQARPGKHREGKMGGMMRELNLTSEQKDKIKAEREKSKDAIKALREKTKASREKIREAFKANASAETLRAAKTEMQAAHKAMVDARFEQVLAIREILTPDQRSKFNDWHEKRHGKFGHGGPEGDDDGDEE